MNIEKCQNSFKETTTQKLIDDRMIIYNILNAINCLV